MSQIMASAAGVPGELPPNLACGFCKQPVGGEFYRAMGRFTCARCAGQVWDVKQRQAFATQPFMQAAAAGLAAAVGGALAWAAIVHITHFEIGIVASLIGVGVGKAVVAAAGKRRGPAYQWLAVGLALLGVAGGKVLLVGWSIVSALQDHGKPVTFNNIVRIFDYLMKSDASALFGGFDLVWIGIAVYAAWRLCRAPAITLAGPFPLPTAAPPGGLQFQTVEPIAPDPNLPHAPAPEAT